MFKPVRFVHNPASYLLIQMLCKTHAHVLLFCCVGLSANYIYPDIDEYNQIK